MKKVQYDLLFILLLLAVATWTQSHAFGLSLLMGLGLIPLIGSVITTPKKRARRQSRLGVVTALAVLLASKPPSETRTAHNTR